MSTTLLSEEREHAAGRTLLPKNDAPVQAASKPYCGGQEPIFLAALAFSAGIVAANYLWRSPYIWLAGFLIAATSAAFALRRSPQTGFALALAAMLPLGAFYLQARDAAQVTVAENLQPFATGESSVDVVAHVIREGLIRDSPYGGKQESVDVESEQLRLGEGQLSTAVGIRLTIYSKRTVKTKPATPASNRPSAFTPMESACDSPPNSVCLGTTAIPAQWILRATSARREFA